MPTLTSADSYQSLLESVYRPEMSLREPEWFTETGNLPSELELQCRWFAGDFGREFTGTNGENIEIVQLGDWNRCAGPDFANVAVKIDGELRQGALELDTLIRDWENHGHAENPAYRDVVLHIHVLGSETGRFFTRDCDHREIPQVQIDPARIDPVRWGKSQALAKLGRCSEPLAAMPDSNVESLLNAAAQYRLKLKAARFLRTEDVHSRDEALFQHTAEAFGYRHNRFPMTVLAQRLPLRQLRGEKEAREALLFGAAGFLEQPTYDDAPEEARPYLRMLWEEWWKRRDEFSGFRNPGWVFSGARPANHPHRRVGALASLVDRWRSYSTVAFAEPFQEKAVTEFFTSLSHLYWSAHYTLKSGTIPGKMRLVGDSRVADLLGNVIYPLAVSRTPGRWSDYQQLRARMPNEKVERAMIRLFGKRKNAKEFVRRFYQQQGLLQIYDDFCLADFSDCADCPFPEQLAKWRGI